MLGAADATSIHNIGVIRFYDLPTEQGVWRIDVPDSELEKVIHWFHQTIEDQEQRDPRTDDSWGILVRYTQVRNDSL